MKQSLFTRLTVLFCAVVISSVLLGSVAELGHPATNSEVQFAQADASTTAQ